MKGVLGMTLEEKVRELAKLLDSSHYAIVLTGPQLAQNAGIPNFRESQLENCNCGCSGHDSNNCTAKQLSLVNLENNPHEVYKIYFALLQAVSQAKPTSGYQVLTQLEQLKLIRKLITENVDSLHQIAGTRNMLEIYGNTHGATCLKCHHKVGVSTLVGKIKEKEMPPRCPKCQGILKPNIILNDEKLSRDFEVAQEEVAKADLLLVIGSNLQIPASRYLANNANKLVIISSQPTPFDNKAQIVVNANVNEVLDILWESTQEELGLL